jgi:hypothetical protein
VLDLDMVACFLAHHDIKFGPKKTANPHVDLLSSRYPAQSASKKALTKVEEDLINVRPRLAVFLTYLSNLLAAFQCTAIGA